MKRSLFGGTFLVVEGVTDGRMYGKFIDREGCMLIPAHSKDNVRASVRENFNRRNDQKVIGIVDSDIDRLKGIAEKEPLFATDCRDSETQMIKSRALENVLTEYGDEEKMDSFEERYGSIRDALVAASYPLGLLMYVSEVRDRGLYFKDTDPSAYVSKIGLKANLDDMISAVIGNSQNTSADHRTVMNELLREMKNDHDPWNVCRGHDMTAVLAFALREVFGDYNSRYIKQGEVAGALRLAYDREMFGSTALYKNTEEWCSEKKMGLWSK